MRRWSRIPSMNQPCRIYAPVGSHEDLLAYLVRRLLENGANTSFVNRLADDEAPIGEIIADPVEQVERLRPIPHPRIPLPRDIFAPRINSHGYAAVGRRHARHACSQRSARRWRSRSRPTALVGGKPSNATGRCARSPSPHDRERQGRARSVEAERRRGFRGAGDCRQGAMKPGTGRVARRAPRFSRRPPISMRPNTARFMALLIREAGKTLDNAQSDLREAVDFLRYYAERAREDFEAPHAPAGPDRRSATRLSLHGRGVFACISPWNFPLAIFTGQVAAALAAGNAVIAKPAEQTPLIAYRGA